MKLKQYMRVGVRVRVRGFLIGFVISSDGRRRWGGNLGMASGCTIGGMEGGGCVAPMWARGGWEGAPEAPVG